MLYYSTFILNTKSSLVPAVLCGTAERRLLGDLLEYYQKFERPVANEADPVRLKFGLTLQQIMDVVRRDKFVSFSSFSPYHFTKISP